MDEEWEAGDRALVMTKFGDVLEIVLLSPAPRIGWWRADLVELNMQAAYGEHEMIRQVTR